METHIPGIKRVASGNFLYDSGSSDDSVVLCEDLEGWEAGGRLKSEGTYVYLWLIQVDIWQKPTQYCEAIVLQLKISRFLN